MFAKSGLTYRALPLPHRADHTDAQMLAAAEENLQVMARRHSIREFSQRPVAREAIEKCVAAAGLAPSGANRQPWHFVAVQDAATKQAIRAAAEEEERAFYDGGAGEEWLKALEPIGTGADKPHLTDAPWLIVIFAQRWVEFDNGTRHKNYYVPESVGIATGFLIQALHRAGLATLTHTPNPMRFLNSLLRRPASEKPVMILVVGHPADDATVPAAAKIKKPLEEILSVV